MMIILHRHTYETERCTQINVHYNLISNLYMRDTCNMQIHPICKIKDDHTTPDLLRSLFYKHDSLMKTHLETKSFTALCCGVDGSGEGVGLSLLLSRGPVLFKLGLVTLEALFSVAGDCNEPDNAAGAFSRNPILLSSSSD